MRMRTFVAPFIVMTKVVATTIVETIIVATIFVATRIFVSEGRFQTIIDRGGRPPRVRGLTVGAEGSGNAA